MQNNQLESHGILNWWNTKREYTNKTNGQWALTITYICALVGISGIIIGYNLESQ